jgi:putative ABC transport system permease protein
MDASNFESAKASQKGKWVVDSWDKDKDKIDNIDCNIFFLNQSNQNEVLLHMVKKIIPAFKMAANTLRSHFFHTFLSILGMVIGVAALVGILCLIDGMEQYAKDQITQTTSLNSMVISSQTTKTVNGISVRKDTFAYVNYDSFQALVESIRLPAKAHLINSQSAEIQIGSDTTPVVSIVHGSSEINPSEMQVNSGLLLTTEHLQTQASVAVVNSAFTKAGNPADSAEVWVGRQLRINGRMLKIIGVANHRSANPEVYIPITLLTPGELKSYPPSVYIEAEQVADVIPIKDSLRTWINRHYKSYQDDISIMTNGFRVEQATQGFQLFRVIMGLIVGISVLVGGIGVMNVMLISVTQRTTEIGVRKAMGAKREDIVLQFLAESITISAFGSICGLILGILGTMTVIPIIKALTKVPFQASYTANTIAVVAILAVLVGIIFGTYPALRASRLDPVEAIRRD